MKQGVIFRGKRLIGCVLALVSLYLPILSYAEDLQKFEVQNNGEIIVTISQRELSRFVFKKSNLEPDTIKQVVGINGEFYHEIQDNNLYLRPSVAKPLNFFVRTEQGNVYKLLTTTKDIPAIQIMVQEKIAGKGSSITRDQDSSGSISESSHLKKEISKVIAVIRAQDRTMGYTIKEIGKSISSKDGLDMDHLSQWSNEDIIADEFVLHNSSSKAVELKKSEYLSAGIQAVYLEKTELLPKESSRLITMKSIR